MGIFIGGGNTAVFQKVYCVEPVTNILKSKYQAGCPIAGVSAGALILMEHCVMGSENDKAAAKVTEGMGLLSGFLIGELFQKIKGCFDISTPCAKPGPIWPTG